MDEMFDHNRDGHLSSAERADRDYFVNEMLNSTSGSGLGGYPRGTGNNQNTGIKLLGGLFLIIGLESFIYFPVFALVMIVLAIIFFTV